MRRATQCSRPEAGASATTSAARGTRQGTAPALGESGREERVAELRVETVVSERKIRDAVVALKLAHPYEEPAYDVYPLVDQ